MTTNTVSRKKLIGLISKKYPESQPSESEEFDSNIKDSIWLLGTEYMGWSASCLHMSSEPTLNDFTEFVESKGWFIEPYDEGTFFLHKI
jgi:hypothetical protein